MPTVPVPQSQVNRSPMPGPRLTAQVNADTMGAATAEGAQAVVNVGAKIYQQEKQKADEVVTLAAYNRTSELNQSLIANATSKRGMDAFGVLDSSLTDYDKQTGEIAGGLHNDEQRMAYQRIRQQGRLQLNDTLQHHVSREHQVVDNAEHQSFLLNAQNAAVSAADLPDSAASKVIAFQNQSQRYQIDAYAKRNGLPPDWATAQKDAAVSATNSGVLARIAASGDHLRAKQFFEANKDDFKGNDFIHAQKVVSESNTRGESQQLADQIMAKALNDPAMTLQDQIAEAKKLAGDNAELRDATVERVHNDNAMRIQSATQRKNQLASYADEQFKTSIDDIDPGVWSQLSDEHRQHYIKREELASKGKEPETDFQFYYDLLDASVKRPDEFKAADASLWKSRLAPPEFKELVKRQLEAKSGNESAATSGYRTTQQIVDDTLRANDFKTKPKSGTTEAEQILRLRRMVDENRTAYRGLNGKDPDAIQTQKIVDDLLIKTADENDWFTWTNHYTFEATDADAVPAEDRIKIISALMRRGDKPTPARIAATYSMKSSNAGK
jgi:hypothetical protein